MILWLRIQFRRAQILLGHKRSTLWSVWLAYVMCLVVFAMFGDRGLITSYQLSRRKNELMEENRKLSQEIIDYSLQVKNFKSDARTIERYAREKLKYSGDNEIQFIFK